MGDMDFRREVEASIHDLRSNGVPKAGPEAPPRWLRLPFVWLIRLRPGAVVSFMCWLEHFTTDCPFTLDDGRRCSRTVGHRGLCWLPDKYTDEPLRDTYYGINWPEAARGRTHAGFVPGFAAVVLLGPPMVAIEVFGVQAAMQAHGFWSTVGSWFVVVLLLSMGVWVVSMMRQLVTWSIQALRDALTRDSERPPRSLAATP